MKTKAVRRLIIVHFCAVAVLGFTFAPPKSLGQGYLNVSTYGVLSSVDRSQAQAIGYDLLNGNYSLFLPNNSSVSIYSMLNDNGVGNAYFYALGITSSTLFSLSQVNWVNIDTLSGSDSGTFGDIGLSYNNFGIGINYGPDGIAGTADDITYTSGNATTLVNAVYGIGIGDSFNIAGSVQWTVDFWSSLLPANITGTYSLFGSSSSINTTIVNAVPGPSIIVVARVGNSIVVSWPNTGSNILQQTSDLAGGNWTTNLNTITTSNGTNSITLIPQAGSLFFRLKQ